MANKGGGVRYLEVGIPDPETGEISVARLGTFKAQRARGRPPMLNREQRTFAGYLMAIVVGDLELRHKVRAPQKAAMIVIAGLRETVAKAPRSERHKRHYLKAVDLLSAIERFSQDDEKRAKALARVFKDSKAIGRAKF